jgi:hypothetical protein
MAAGVAIATLGVARADTAYTATFTTSITYTNVGSGTANVVVNYYPEGSGTPISANLPALPANASSSIFAGNVAGLPSGFKGSAVLSSDQPIAATMVQISTGAGTLVRNRPLANGLSSGASNVLLATVLKNRFDTTSRFAVQNVGASAVSWTLRFFNADSNGALVHTINESNVPAGAAKYYDAGEIAQLPDNFNGSATIDAAGGSVVATVLELSTTGVAASSFEGVTGGSNTVYMPSALCNAFGGYNTFYAVQNTSNSTNANVTVTYSNGGTQTANIPPGAKSSFATCNATGPNMQGYSGSATISSTGAQIVGIGKVNGLGVSSAFVGATGGAAKVVLPYVRWTPTAVYNTGQRQRAFIAVQNVGGAIAASQVTVQYIDKNGAVLGSQQLGALNTGDKQSINSSQALGDVDFGFYPADGSFGGGAIIQGPAGSQLVAVVRIQSSDPGGASGVGEDYTGIPAQ